MILWFHDLARWSMWVFAKLWFRVTLRGAENIPSSGGFLLVANHASHLDPPLLGAVMPRRCRFFARASLGKGRTAQRLLEGLGTVFVDREAPSRSSMQVAIDLLVEGWPLVFFPEGTRSDDGSLGAFKRGWELIVRRSKVPVVPVGLRGTHRAFPRGKILPRPYKVEVHVGAPIDATELADAQAGARLRASVAQLAGLEVDPAPANETESNIHEHRVRRSAHKAGSAGSRAVGAAADGPRGARSH